MKSTFLIEVVILSGNWLYNAKLRIFSDIDKGEYPKKTQTATVALPTETDKCTKIQLKEIAGGIFVVSEYGRSKLPRKLDMV